MSKLVIYRKLEKIMLKEISFDKAVRLLEKKKLKICFMYIIMGNVHL